MTWRGVLIIESLKESIDVWDRVEVESRCKRRLEQEEQRGEFTFCNVSIPDADVDCVMSQVAAQLRSPGWYFHVENGGRIKVAYPNKVIEMSSESPDSVKMAREYGISIGIHPEQLCFERLMGNPFDE